SDLDPVANTVTINLTAVNDAPLGSDRTISVTQNATFTFGLSDIGFSDPSDSPQNSLLAVRINSLPPTRSLTVNGSSAAGGHFASLTLIQGGTFRYTRANSFSGAESFSLQVQDNGGTANGGVDLSVSSNLYTMSVSGGTINHEPSGTNITIPTFQDVAYTLQ